MLSALSLACIAGTISVATSTQPEAPASMYRLPVRIVDCAGSPAGRAPVAVVGTLFTGGHCYREYDADRLSLTPADQLVLPAPASATSSPPR